MKAIFTLTLVLFLVGCGTVTNPYDNNEYELWVRMLYNSQELEMQCETAPKAEIHSNLTRIYEDARLASIYAQYTPLNSEVFTVSEILVKDADELREFYRINDHNVTYCSRKAALMTKKIEAIIGELAERLRI